MAAITWQQVPTTKKLTLPSGNSYWIKDDEVRQWIGDGSTAGAEKRLSDAETAIAALSNATHWLGITTTALTDGSTANPITINGESVTAVSGDIVQDSNGDEYIFNGTAWQKFGGSIGTLGAMAYVDTGTATYTPAGSNASSAVSFSGQTSGKLDQTTVPNVTDVGTAASWSATVENEVMTFSFTADTVPTLGTAITVATGSVSSNGTGSDVVTDVGTGTAAAQTFSGTQATITVNPTSST